MTQKVDAWGRVVLDEQSVVELFLKGVDITSDLLVENSPAMENFNHWCKTFDATDQMLTQYQDLNQSPEKYHADRQSEWLIPDQYLNVDVREFLLDKCVNDIQRRRVADEMMLFEERGMIPVLRLFMYIVDTLRKHDVLWGVGRGSSVASYCLFLLGVHKIDSIKYELDILEFIR